jgi:hypothetical protein
MPLIRTIPIGTHVTVNGMEGIVVDEMDSQNLAGGYVVLCRVRFTDDCTEWYLPRELTVIE